MPLSFSNFNYLVTFRRPRLSPFPTELVVFPSSRFLFLAGLSANKLLKTDDLTFVQSLSRFLNGPFDFPFRLLLPRKAQRSPSRLDD